MRELGGTLPEGLADYVELLDEMRAMLRKRWPDDPARRKEAFAAALASEEARWLAEDGKREAADQRLLWAVAKIAGQPIHALLIGDIELHHTSIKRLQIGSCIRTSGCPDHLPARRGVLACKLQPESTVGAGNEDRTGPALALFF